MWPVVTVHVHGFWTDILSDFRLRPSRSFLGHVSRAAAPSEPFIDSHCAVPGCHDHGVHDMVVRLGNGRFSSHGHGEDASEGFASDRQTTSARTRSFPRLRGSRRCRKPTPISRQRMHGSPGNARGMHASMHETCTRGAWRRLRGTLQGGQPALELRRPRACGAPVDVGNRPQFRANGCTGAPEMHRECMQLCTKRAFAVRLEESSAGFVTGR